MTVDERLSKLEKQIEDLRLERDVVHSESLKKRVLQGVINAGIKSAATDTDVNESVVAVPAIVARAFDAKVRVEIDGTAYYIGLQNV